MASAYLERVQIETFHGCNAKCSMCPVDKSPRSRGPMAPEVFSEILHQLKAFRDQLKVLTLYMHGEPLLDKMLEDRICQCKRSGFKNVGFSTNASLLSAGRAEAILHAQPDWIAFSFESLEKDIFESIRIGLQFEQVLENIVNFIDLRNNSQSRTRISMRFIAQSANEREFDAYFRFFSHRLIDGKDEIRLVDRHNWGLEENKHEETAPASCPLLFDRCVILRDGTIPLCCVDYIPIYNLGNIMQQSLAGIWNSRQWHKIRKLHLSGQHGSMKMCGACDVSSCENKTYRRFGAA